MIESRVVKFTKEDILEALSKHYNEKNKTNCTFYQSILEFNCEKLYIELEIDEYESTQNES